MKGPQELLEELVDEFRKHVWYEGLLNAREFARGKLAKFEKDYPLRDRPGAVKSVIQTSYHAEDFVRRLELDLWWLGGIDLHSKKPIKEAGQNLDAFRHLVARAVNPEIPVWNRIDGQWDIPGFAGENRQIAKKMVNTYYPESTMPIFNTEHGEHFALYLRLDKDSISNELYQCRFSALVAPGKIWHVLSEALARERDQNSDLKDEDNVYFMYCLYYTEACPPGVKPGKP